ncbi:MAG: hypothetical protein U1E39_13235 [Planctomycetota bacterium]
MNPNERSLVRRVPCLVFCDESGQFQTRGDLSLVAALIVADLVEERDRLRDVAGQLAPAVSRDGKRRKLVPSLVTDAMLESVRRAVFAGGWIVHFAAARWEEPAVRSLRTDLLGFVRPLLDAPEALDVGGAPDLRPYFAAEDIERWHDQDVAYAMTLFHVLSTGAGQLESMGDYPLMRVVVDRRAGIRSALALEIIARMAVSPGGATAKARLAQVLGIAPTRRLNISIAGDEGTCGLEVADLIAKTYAAALDGGRRDPDGRWAAFRASLDRAPQSPKVEIKPRAAGDRPPHPGC